MAWSRQGKGKVKARARWSSDKVKEGQGGQDKIRERLKQSNHHLNNNYNSMGFDTIEMNLFCRSLKTWSCLCFPLVKKKNYNPHQISQLLQSQFWPNFKRRFTGTSRTDSNCHSNICSGNSCPYQEYISYYLLDFGSWKMLWWNLSRKHMSICPNQQYPKVFGPKFWGPEFL